MILEYSVTEVAKCSGCLTDSVLHFNIKFAIIRQVRTKVLEVTCHLEWLTIYREGIRAGITTSRS